MFLSVFEKAWKNCFLFVPFSCVGDYFRLFYNFEGKCKNFLCKKVAVNFCLFPHNYFWVKIAKEDFGKNKKITIFISTFLPQSI